jgi:hypothetical protein
MPKRLIRKYLPNPEKIANMRGLGFLRNRLQDPNLWTFGIWCGVLGFMVCLFANAFS